MKQILKVVLLFFISLRAFAQPPTISGEGTPCPNVDYNYQLSYQPSNCSITWALWDSNGQNNSLGSISVNSNDPTKAIIKWNIGATNNPYIKVTYSGTNCSSGDSRTPTINVQSVFGKTPTITNPNGFAFCGNTLRLSVSNSGTDLRYAKSWEWTLPAGWVISGIANSPVIDVTVPNGCSVGTVKVRAKGAGSCPPASDHYSNDGQINLTRTGGNATITPPFENYEARCGVQSAVTFSVASVPACGNAVWELPAGWQTSSGQSGIVTMPAGNKNITLIPSGTNGGDLKASISVCGVTASNSTYTINYNPISNLPQEGSIVGSNLLCTGQSGTYTAPSYSDVTYSWYVNFRLRQTSTSNQFTLTDNGEGLRNIEVRMVKGAGCGSVNLSRDIWIGASPTPNQFLWNHSSQGIIGTIQSTPSVIYTSPWSYYYIDLFTAAPISVSGSSDGYIWEHNGSVISGNGQSNVITIPPNAEGYGSVTVRTYNSCGESTVLTWNYQTVICNDPSGNCGGGGCDPCIGNRVATYPNPANDMLNLDNSLNEEVTVKIYNKLGKLVATKRIDKNSKTKLPTDKLPEGVYYLHIISGKETKKEMITIKH